MWCARAARGSSSSARSAIRAAEAGAHQLTPRVRSRKRIALIGCAVFAVASFAFAMEGGMPWWAGPWWIVCFLALLLPGTKGLIDEVDLSDVGVARRFAPRL